MLENAGDCWRMRLLSFMIWSDEHVRWMLVNKMLSVKESHIASRHKVKPRIQFTLLPGKEEHFIFLKIQPSKKYHLERMSEHQLWPHHQHHPWIKIHKVQHYSVFYISCPVPRALYILIGSIFKITLWSRFTIMITVIPLLFPSRKKGNQRLNNVALGHTASKWENHYA